MEEKLVEYYISLDALDGIDTNNAHQYDTNTGILIKFIETVAWLDEKPFQVTKALIENAESGDVHLIDPQLIKRFVYGEYSHIV